MTDHPDDRPPKWETILMTDHPSERQSWWQTTQVTDHPDDKPPWWQTTQVTDHPNDKPPSDRPLWWQTTPVTLSWWQTTLMTDHPNDRQYWWQTTPVTDYPDDRSDKYHLENYMYTCALTQGNIHIIICMHQSPIIHSNTHYSTVKNSILWVSPHPHPSLAWFSPAHPPPFPPHSIHILLLHSLSYSQTPHLLSFYWILLQCLGKQGFHAHKSLIKDLSWWQKSDF